jgi:phenylacetate-coenzyme A ligase PaaK-like adenylate-forming protein
MYWFGREINQQSEWMNDEEFKNLSSLKFNFAMTSLEDILDTLNEFSKLWHSKSVFYQEALIPLQDESGFTLEEVKSTLNLLPELLKKESLLARLRGEFIDPKVLDDFTKLPRAEALVKAVPRGLTLHVTAGNVFLSSIDSLIMGFLTKNLSLVKVSSQNKFFPLYFSQKLASFDKKKILSDKFAILHWKGGVSEVESFLKKKVSTIIAWGGEEMLSSYQKDLPKGVKLLDFGPKISIQLISKAGLENKNISLVAESIVADIIPWDQGACASPQNLYLQEGIDEKSFIREIDIAFAKSRTRGQLTNDEAVEILKEKYRSLYSELMETGASVSGKEHLIHLENNKILRPSPLGRTLIIKRFNDAQDLYSCLEPFNFYLQSCSYLLTEEERKAYLKTLSLTGIKRFTSLGTVTWGMNGAPHDGRYVLRELVNFVGDEARIRDFGESFRGTQTSTKLKEFFENSTHPKGYIFSSGGTTGEPKYVHYSYEEFDRMTDMLADNFRAQGILPGAKVANLFVAGNLWSSFLAVEKALEKIGAIQFPIGGLCPNENIVAYLNKFQPQVVMGIPSLLVMNAELCLSLGLKIKIPKVFFAGEAMSDTRKEFLQKNWGVEYFGSAGYASVDAGVIGYQCLSCGPGEHHVFSQVVDLKIINNEGIVTSYSRDSLPIRNYATGDRMEWVEQPCACGRVDKKFRLLGRIDNLIQIWSCRLSLNDVEKAIRELHQEVLSYQVLLTEEQVSHKLIERFELTLESDEKVDSEKLIRLIYDFSRDLKDTISLASFKSQLSIKCVRPGEIKRNSRTGKISLILDRRH